jgi:urease accessory protein
VPTDARAPDAIGRRARLELRFEARCGRTILAHSYAEPPLRIGRVHDLGGAAYVILVCSGPGIFGGDELSYTIHVARGARVVLTSQSALQAHPSVASAAPPSSGPSALHPSVSALVPSCPPALCRHEYVVEADAELHCDWDPLIPFSGARIDQRVDLHVASGGRLFWADALMAGRVSRGEVWRFDALSHELALRTGGRLSYLERYTIVPAEGRVDHAWVAGGARYIATTLVHHPDATAELADAWQREAAAVNSTVQVGVDAVAPDLIVARVLAADGAPFARARASYRAAALRDIFRSPELATRK